MTAAIPTQSLLDLRVKKRTPIPTDSKTGLPISKNPTLSRISPCIFLVRKPE